MTEGSSQSGREHEVGTLNAPLLTLDLNREIQQLRSEGRWQDGHTAKTLAKYPNLRVVLIVMKEGGYLAKHQTEGRFSLQPLEGRIRFRTAERSVDLAPGQMLTADHNIPHDVEGIVDSAFLLTLAWHDASSLPFGSDS
jgi:quercetin dioxygenase-like cupin family protein